MNIFATGDQIGVLTSSARWLAMFTGRRWGKTTTGVLDMVSRTTARPIRYGYCSPSYAQLVGQFDELRSCRAYSMMIRRVREDKPYPHVILKNGSRVDFRTLGQPKRIRGERYNRLFIDESQDVREDVYSEILEPTLADLRGSAIIAGQFRGRDWRYRRFYLPGVLSLGLQNSMTIEEIAQASTCGADELLEVADKMRDAGQDITDYAAWRFPTSSGLRFVDEGGQAELSRIKRDVPEQVYSQEYDCIPGAKANCVFRPEYIAQVRKGDRLTEGIKGGSYIASCDVGRIVDPTAVVVLECERNKLPRVVYEEIMPLRQPHEKSARRFAEIVCKFSTGSVVSMVDISGGGGGRGNRPEQLEEIYRAAVPKVAGWIWDQRKKERAVSDLAVGVEQGKIQIATGLPKLVEQMEAYEYKYVTESRRYIYQGPDGSNDDLVSALLKAYQAYLMGWTEFRGHSVTEVI